jgi:hypothetical protein
LERTTNVRNVKKILVFAHVEIGHNQVVNKFN